MPSAAGWTTTSTSHQRQHASPAAAATGRRSPRSASPTPAMHASAAERHPADRSSAGGPGRTAARTGRSATAATRTRRRRRAAGRVARVSVDRYMKLTRSTPPKHADRRRDRRAAASTSSTIDATATPAEQPGDRRRVLSRERIEGDEHQRPQEVELLLDRQAPQVAQQRRVAGVVRDVADDLAPVAEVAERPRQVAPQLSPRCSAEPTASATTATDASTTASAGSSRRARRSQNRPRSTRPGTLVLVEQQRRDQEPGHDEEHLDADPPAVHPGEPGVVADHGDDRQGPQPVEAGLVAEAARRAAAAAAPGRCRRRRSDARRRVELSGVSRWAVAPVRAAERQRASGQIGLRGRERRSPADGRPGRRWSRRSSRRPAARRGWRRRWRSPWPPAPRRARPPARRRRPGTSSPAPSSSPTAPASSRARRRRAAAASASPASSAALARRTVSNTTAIAPGVSRSSSIALAERGRARRRRARPVARRRCGRRTRRARRAALGRLAGCRRRSRPGCGSGSAAAASGTCARRSCSRRSSRFVDVAEALRHLLALGVDDEARGASSGWRSACRARPPGPARSRGAGSAGPCPPQCRSKPSPSRSRLITTHSLCQPGRPSPHGDGHDGSPGLASFHSTKSAGWRLPSAPTTSRSPPPASMSSSDWWASRP